MGKPSRHSDETWDAAFEREKAGARRGDLAVELGVSLSTMNWQAKKRGLKRGVTPGWVDRRRRPEGGWPADHVFHQGRARMTPRRWDELLARYVAGEAIEALALEYGVAEATISRQAEERGMRKMDRPEAVYRPRGPTAAAPGTGVATAGRAGLAFDWDPDDPLASAAALTALETAAAREGRAADFLTLRRMRRAAGLKAARRRGPRPEMSFEFKPDDPTATYGSILNAMLRAMYDQRDDDFRELERLLRQTERIFRDGELWARR
ncbi:hypothetical protein [Brevundimonas sp.]|uniref:hypothetical protein n=1 Tax=Brevundimonas sp. TaxID=1871086 RepID=UPI002D48E99D|nr:hypothetical protein [Brevundimonas sp.]HYC99077.1 hypothetical protein [Brevundimonas sp.]